VVVSVITLWTRKNKADTERKGEKGEAAARKLNELTPVLVVPDLATMHAAEIELQIRWHRVFAPKFLREKDLPLERMRS
jgi:hypothetical protein